MVLQQDVDILLSYLVWTTTKTSLLTEFGSVGH